MDKLPFFWPKGLEPGDLDEALEERKDRFDDLLIDSSSFSK
jgi:hypothetical protein